jgi:hypothetical protein
MDHLDAIYSLLGFPIYAEFYMKEYAYFILITHGRFEKKNITN